MEIRTIRIKNLKGLVDNVGTIAGFARQYNGIDPTYISQLLNGHRSFGERAARNMERKIGLPMGSLDRKQSGDNAEQEAVIIAQPNMPIKGYIRLEHLPYQPSMGTGLAHDGDAIVQHMDVLETFVKQKIGTTNPNRIKLLTGIGQSMMPTIQDQDIVFVDVEQRWIDAPGIYVIDVGGLLLLKKALILSSGTLVLRSDNTEEYPDEERFDLAKVGDSITVCGKVLAWWTLRKG